MSGIRVVVTREGGHWLADVPELDGTHTYAKSLVRLDAEVREAIALALDLPEGDEEALKLDWDIHTGDEVLDQRAARIRRVRLNVEAAERALQDETAAVAAQYRGRNTSVRDTAFLVSISHQRVSQLV